MRAVHVAAVHRDVEPISFATRHERRTDSSVRAADDVVDEAVAKLLATLDRYTLAGLVRPREITSARGRSRASSSASARG